MFDTGFSNRMSLLYVNFFLLSEHDVSEVNKIMNDTNTKDSECKYL